MNIYEVNENNEVYAWSDGDRSKPPFLYQPNYPDGTPFETKEQAEDWAAKWYAHFSDPVNNPEFPASPE